MKDFSNASFPPETIVIMKSAMDAAVATLPDPVNSTHAQWIAESILRTAKDGERDPAKLQRMALLELQIRPRHVGDRTDPRIVSHSIASVFGCTIELGNSAKWKSWPTATRDGRLMTMSASSNLATPSASVKADSAVRRRSPGDS